MIEIALEMSPSDLCCIVSAAIYAARTTKRSSEDLSLAIVKSAIALHQVTEDDNEY